MSEQLSLFDIGAENNLLISPNQKRKLKALYEQGYRYVTDNSECEYYPLSFWSLRPTRMRVREGDSKIYYYWGYQDKDCGSGKELMSSPIDKFDIESLHGLTTHKPILITYLL
jgi:hypothetical protein